MSRIETSLGHLRELNSCGGRHSINSRSNKNGNDCPLGSDESQLKGLKWRQVQKRGAVWSVRESFSGLQSVMVAIAHHVVRVSLEVTTFHPLLG